VQRPELVHVHLERDVTDPAHSADALDVEAVAPAELQLQAFEASADLLGAPRHVVRIAEPDRPRSRRAGALEAEEPPDRQAGELAAEVVQGRVDGRLRCLLTLPLTEPALDRFERKWIVAQHFFRALEKGKRRGGGL